MDQIKKQVKCPDHNEKIKFICIKNNENNSNIFACYDCIMQKQNSIPFILIKDLADTIKQKQIGINKYLITKHLPDVSKEKIDKMATNLDFQITEVENFFRQTKAQLKDYLKKQKSAVLQKYKDCRNKQQKLNEVLSEVNSFYNCQTFREQMIKKMSQLNQGNQIEISNSIRQYLLSQENVYTTKLNQIQELYKQCETESLKLLEVDYKNQIKNDLGQYINQVSKYNFEISKYEQSSNIIQESGCVFKNVVGKQTQAIIGNKSFSSGVHQLIIKLLKKPSTQLYLSFCNNTTRSYDPIWGCITCDDTHFANSNFIDVLKDGSQIKMIMDFEKNTASITEMESQRTAHLTGKVLNNFQDLRFAITWYNPQHETPIEILYCD